MNRIKLISNWILSSGIIIAIIGLVHNAMGIPMYKAMCGSEMKAYANGFAYFFVVGGTSFFLAGLLTIFCSFGLKRKENWAFIITIMSGIFLAAAMLAAILFAKFGNPLIYLTLICATINVIILLLFRNELK